MISSGDVDELHTAASSEIGHDHHGRSAAVGRELRAACALSAGRRDGGSHSAWQLRSRFQCRWPQIPGQLRIRAAAVAGTGPVVPADTLRTAGGHGVPCVPLLWLSQGVTLDCMTNHLLAWSGIDDPSRVDQASVELNGESMRAIGGALARNFSSSWELDVASGWVTRALRVTTRGYGWMRTLDLTRSDDGHWAAETSFTGEVDLPLPGLPDPESLVDAVDCDLGLCPITNTMPIRRLGLLDHEVQDTQLVMAWVEMPSLRVLRSDQVYASGLTGIRGSVAYTSFSRDFSAHLTVDDAGLVIDYPTLARRV